MNIVVLNGSPRENGNTAALVEAFRKGAEKNFNQVEVLAVGLLNIAGCKGCEYCHTEGNGACIQKDDMEKVYKALEKADMILFASPIYYWGFSSQMQSTITRFYNTLKPKAGEFSLLLSSGSPDVYEGVIAQYKKMVHFFSGKDLGIRCYSGKNQLTESNLKEMFDFGYSL